MLKYEIYFCKTLRRQHHTAAAAKTILCYISVVKVVILLN